MPRDDLAGCHDAPFEFRDDLVLSSGWTICQSGFCGQVTPNLPRTIQRERVARGGALAIVRDISHSMWGVHSKWASSVILRLIELTRRTHMRLGYIEFNEREQSTGRALLSLRRRHVSDTDRLSGQTRGSIARPRTKLAGRNA